LFIVHFTGVVLLSAFAIAKLAYR